MSKAKFSADDDALLNELGIETKAKKSNNHTNIEERIIAGFDEIETFYEKNGKLPILSDDKSIFERLYAIRLNKINSVQSNHELLKDFDKHGLLDINRPELNVDVDKIDDNALLEELGVEIKNDESITRLRNVKPRVEINAADEVAIRTKCKDFDKFEDLFRQVNMGLKKNIRESVKYKDYAAIEVGDFFILSGQITYIAEKGVEFINKYGRADSKLRVIYDNGTETDGMLMRSLQRALNKDTAARRISSDQLISLFSDTFEDGDLKSGQIYVLKSKSEHPIVVEHRDLIHKIGVTGGSVKVRIGNAKYDPTFLMADVEVVAEYSLANINKIKLESLIHKFFDSARLNIDIKDRFGKKVNVKEWFMVPLFVIDEMILKLQEGSIDKYTYDKSTASIKKI